MKFNLNLFFEKLVTKLNRIFLTYFGRVVRKIFSPSIPDNDLILVHLGCGELNDKKYINIDARSFPHVHFVTEDLSLKQFGDKSIDLIYACHVLEHVSHRKIKDLVRSWYSKLKIGGKVRISVPDFDRIIEIYNDNDKCITTIQCPLMGGQEYSTNFHMSALNYNFLKSLFEICNFKDVYLWDPKNTDDHNFDDWSVKKLSVNGKEYEISLNIEALK